MHCLTTLSVLNQRAAQANKSSAIHRIKALRDDYDRRIHRLRQSQQWTAAAALAVVAGDLDILIIRIERDEKEVS